MNILIIGGGGREHALAWKVAQESIEEALGRKPERLPGYEDIGRQSQRFVVMEADAAAVKDYIARLGRFEESGALSVMVKQGTDPARRASRNSCDRSRGLG